MRAFFAVYILLMSGLVAAQDSLFSTVRPDLMIVVREHNTGAEIVQITSISKAYPADLLREQIAKVGLELGVDPRGVQVTQQKLGTQANVSFTRAEFAVNGLIDRENGLLKLQPLVKAFVGAPEPNTIRGLKIAFEGERPTKKMLQRFSIANVLALEGRASLSPPGIEYQIRIDDQDPSKVAIPDEYQKPANQTPAQSPSTAPSRSLIIGLFVLGGLGVGALVYLAILRSGSRSPR